jgi:hypothetical protein
MKSYEQLGRAAHTAFVNKLPEAIRNASTSWEKLLPEVRESWIDAARAVAAEVATIL